MDTFSIKKAAEILGLHPNTVRKMVTEKKIFSYKTSSGSYEISEKELYKHLVFENYKSAASLLPEESDVFKNISNFVSNLPNFSSKLIKNIDKLSWYRHAPYGETLIAARSSVTSKYDLITGKMNPGYENIGKICAYEIESTQLVPIESDNHYLHEEVSSFVFVEENVSIPASRLVTLESRVSVETGKAEKFLIRFPLLDNRFSFLESDLEYIILIFAYRYYFSFFDQLFQNKHLSSTYFSFTMYLITAFLHKYHLNPSPPLSPDLRFILTSSPFNNDPIYLSSPARFQLLSQVVHTTIFLADVPPPPPNKEPTLDSFVEMLISYLPSSIPQVSNQFLKEYEDLKKKFIRTFLHKVIDQVDKI